MNNRSSISLLDLRQQSLNQSSNNYPQHTCSFAGAYYIDIKNIENVG